MNEPNTPPRPTFKNPRELENLLTSSAAAPVATKVDVEQAQKEEKIKLDERQIEEIRSLRLNNDHLQAEIDKIKQDNKGRRLFSAYILIIMIIWMLLVLLTVIASGLGLIRLSENVLIALLTTTTANVIGLMLIVANYLFNKEKST